MPAYADRRSSGLASRVASRADYCTRGAGDNPGHVSSPHPAHGPGVPHIHHVRRYWLVGLIGLIAGTVASWNITGNWPYTENRVRITVIDVAFPLAFTVIAVLVAYLVVRRRSGEYPQT